MPCKTCGAEIYTGSKFCQACGAKVDAVNEPSTVSTRKSKWLSLAILSFLGLTGIFTYFNLHDNSLDDIVASQVKAIKEKHFTEAYYQHTGKEFQRAYSLGAFREFVKNYPFFAENTGIEWVNSEIKGSAGAVKVLLTAKNGAKAFVDYQLVKEGNHWKILYIQVRDDEQKNIPQSHDQKQAVFEPIEKQLKALQVQNIEAAYEGVVSLEFRRQSRLDQYQAFVKEHPILTHFKDYTYGASTVNGNEAEVTLYLNPRKDNVAVKYTLIKENDDWKIWGMQIVLPKGFQASLDKAAAQVRDVFIGSEVHDDGVLINPNTQFSQKTGDLFANISVESGSPGEVIVVSIRHVETGAETPQTSLTLENAGNSREVLYFEPPAGGWPVGNYELVVLSSIGTGVQIPFQIN